MVTRTIAAVSTMTAKPTSQHALNPARAEPTPTMSTRQMKGKRMRTVQQMAAQRAARVIKRPGHSGRTREVARLETLSTERPRNDYVD